MIEIETQPGTTYIKEDPAPLTEMSETSNEKACNNTTAAAAAADVAAQAPIANIERDEHPSGNHKRLADPSSCLDVNKQAKQMKLCAGDVAICREQKETGSSESSLSPNSDIKNKIGVTALNNQNIPPYPPQYTDHQGVPPSDGSKTWTYPGDDTDVLNEHTMHHMIRTFFQGMSVFEAKIDRIFHDMSRIIHEHTSLTSGIEADSYKIIRRVSSIKHLVEGKMLNNQTQLAYLLEGKLLLLFFDLHDNVNLINTVLNLKERRVESDNHLVTWMCKKGGALKESLEQMRVIDPPVMMGMLDLFLEELTVYAENFAKEQSDNPLVTWVSKKGAALKENLAQMTVVDKQVMTGWLDIFLGELAVYAKSLVNEQSHK